MIKAPCRSMKSDGGVKTKEKSTRTPRQQTEKSAVCYEARAARDVTDACEKQRLCPCFQSCVRSCPGVLRSSVTSDKVHFSLFKCKHEEVPWLRFWVESRTGRGRWRRAKACQRCRLLWASFSRASKSSASYLLFTGPGPASSKTWNRFVCNSVLQHITLA